MVAERLKWVNVNGCVKKKFCIYQCCQLDGHVHKLCWFVRVSYSEVIRQLQEIVLYEIQLSGSSGVQRQYIAEAPKRGPYVSATVGGTYIKWSWPKVNQQLQRPNMTIRVPLWRHGVVARQTLTADCWANWLGAMVSRLSDSPRTIYHHEWRPRTRLTSSCSMVQRESTTFTRAPACCIHTPCLVYLSSRGVCLFSSTINARG